jgi:hypothetical protein
MNRKDQNSIASLYVENINQMGALGASKGASTEEMAGMIAKHPDANKPLETTMSFDAPAGYDISYDKGILTISRNINGMESKTMTSVGEMSVDDLQKAVDYQVAYDEFIKARSGQGPEGAAAAKNVFKQKAKEIYSK